MKLSAREFRLWENRRITLIGMSGVGKTRVATLLRKRDWFHYSADYRIGTRYLDEPILDNIKQQAMRVPFLRDLLRSDSIYIANNITVDNLQPVSSFLGKMGNPEKGGLSLREFHRRQALHKAALIGAMRDVPEFIRKAQEIYGYRHFVNVAGGNVCDLDDPSVIELLAEHTLILCVQVTSDDERELFRRAEEEPGPLFFSEAFLEEKLAVYLREKGLPYAAMVDPDDFARWVYPEFYRSRKPRYQAIADTWGYTVTSEALGRVRDEAGFLSLVESTLER